MDQATRRITNALKTAIRREERTARAYEQKAKKVKDPSAKKVLQVLVKQEMGHARKIQVVLDKGLDLSRIGRTGKRQIGELHVLNDDVRRLEKTTEAVRVLKSAIKAEENSCRLYRSLEKIFKGADVAVLFGKLAEEEEKHKARLEKTLARI